MILPQRPRIFDSFLPSLLTLALTGGCATPTTRQGSETDSLSDVTQLTRGFDRAGEAYFSPKMDWIVFQATPHGQTNYQMYMAPLTLHPQVKLGDAVRISPTPS